jgi:DDE superfamily endonuclease
MIAVWASRQEDLLSDCVVAPHVFDHMVDRLYDFVVPYQRCLETEAEKRKVSLDLAGLLSHLPRKNAEEIAALVDVERLVMQQFIGTAPWDHRPLVKVLVGQVVDRLGEPDGIIAFDPSSYPKRGCRSRILITPPKEFRAGGFQPSSDVYVSRLVILLLRTVRPMSAGEGGDAWMSPMPE